MTNITPQNLKDYSIVNSILYRVRSNKTINWIIPVKNEIEEIVDYIMAGDWRDFIPTQPGLYSASFLVKTIHDQYEGRSYIEIHESSFHLEASHDELCNDAMNRRAAGAKERRKE